MNHYKKAIIDGLARRAAHAKNVGDGKKWLRCLITGKNFANSSIYSAEAMRRFVEVTESLDTGKIEVVEELPAASH